ncbi:MAG: NusG domain II-containing protein, partial [Clostridia bacterium]
MKSNIKWIAVFAALCAVCAGVIAYRYFTAGDGRTAKITLNGEVIKTVDLSVTEPYEFDVESGGGYNRIRVENGRIAVIDADCPDRLCVKQGYAKA